MFSTWLQKLYVPSRPNLRDRTGTGYVVPLSTSRVVLTCTALGVLHVPLAALVELYTI